MEKKELYEKFKQETPTSCLTVMIKEPLILDWGRGETSTTLMENISIF